MDTEIDTKSTDIPIAVGCTQSERLNMDIIEETKNRSVSIEYKNDRKAKFVELRARGASYQDIATILGCSKTTLISWNREMADDIAEYKAMTKNDILYDYQVARDNRLRYFAILYRKLKNEIERRSLRDISTDKLYTMLERCSRCIDELSGERREEKQQIGILAVSHTERVETALKCVRAA